MSSSERLRDYMAKRDLTRSPEPSDEATGPSDGPVFVIQKHAARTLHYDLRLEVDGVLKSWAVPKGPSLDPRERRLAVPVEDHPLAYATFEGTIPEGEYGAGAVLVWDIGTYEPLPRDDGSEYTMAQALDEGLVAFRLLGKKLRGGYALIRTGKGEKARWLLVKKRDEHAASEGDITQDAPLSVFSGRGIEEI